jgi:NAD-dependent deacetylase
MENKLIDRLAKDILASGKTIALTGAGVSVESGIPDFRSAGGLWSRYDPEEYAHIDGFRRNPVKVWNMLREIIAVIKAATPNPGHRSLAELEKIGYLSSIITQNVDGLHQEAGSKNVIEFHGSNRFLICPQCGFRSETKHFDTSYSVPRCPTCSTILKPDVVFFGEAIPTDVMAKAFDEAEKAELVLVIGTSAVVYPASGIPAMARRHGAKIVEINLEETDLTRHTTDYFIKGTFGKTFPRVTERVHQLSGEDLQ